MGIIDILNYNMKAYHWLVDVEKITNCVVCRDEILNDDVIGAYGNNDEVMTIKNGYQMRCRIKDDYGPDRYIICEKCIKDTKCELIWEHECSGCHMKWQEDNPYPDSMNGGYGLKDNNDTTELVSVAVFKVPGFDNYVQGGWPSQRHDMEIFKVHDDWKESINEPNFNICDDCVDKYVENGEFEQVDRTEWWKKVGKNLSFCKKCHIGL